MNSCTLPAFRSDGTPVTLAEVLSHIRSGEEMRWSVIDFYGVGLAPDGLTMDEFERRSRRLPGGVALSWRQLRAFADGLQQTIDCEVVGSRLAAGVATEEGQTPSTEDSHDLVLKMLDSTKWEIFSTDKSLIRKMASLAKTNRA